MQDFTTISAGKHPPATGTGMGPLGAARGWGAPAPPRSLLQTRQGLSLAGGSPEPCAGFLAGFVLCGCRALALRREEGLGCSPRCSIFWCQPCRGPVARQFNSDRLPQPPTPMGLHPLLCTDGTGAARLGQHGQAGTGRQGSPACPVPGGGSAASDVAQQGLTAPPALTDYSQDEKALLGACDCSQSECDASGPCSPLARHSFS